MENIFTNATRKKYRFEYKGLISVEDLWDLSVIELDKVYKGLRTKARLIEDEDSLLTTKSTENKDLNEQIEIVRYIVSVKNAEAKEAVDAVERAQKRQRIMDIINKKQNEALENMSIDELAKMLDD